MGTRPEQVHVSTSGGAVGRTGFAAALLGGTAFLAGTLLHPARDGLGMAEAGQLYGLTHAIQAIGLMLQVVALAALRPAGRSGPGSGWYVAVTGTVWWLALIVYDGAHNPVTAHYVPHLVHSPTDLDAGALLIVVPALVLFPVGYLWFGRQLWQDGQRVTGGLLGIGALTYTIGGLLIFLAGPASPLVQPAEVLGAAGYAFAFVRLGWRRRARGTEPEAASASLGSFEGTVR